MSHIQEYARILGAAESRVAAKWEAESVPRAFGWALFIERHLQRVDTADVEVIDQELLVIYRRQEGCHWPHELDAQPMTRQLLTCHSLRSEPGAFVVLTRALLLNRTPCTKRYAELLLQALNAKRTQASSSHVQSQGVSMPSSAGDAAVAPSGVDAVCEALLPSVRLKAKVGLAHAMLKITAPYRVADPLGNRCLSGASQTKAQNEERQPPISARTLARLLQSASGRRRAPTDASDADDPMSAIEARFFEQPIFNLPLFIEAACWLVLGCPEPFVDSVGNCTYFPCRHYVSQLTPLQHAALQPVLRAAQPGSPLWQCDPELIASVCAAHASWHAHVTSSEADDDIGSCVGMPLLLARYCSHLETLLLQLLSDDSSWQPLVMADDTQPPSKHIRGTCPAVHERLSDWERYCRRWHALLEAVDGELHGTLCAERARHRVERTREQRAWIQRAVALTPPSSTISSSCNWVRPISRAYSCVVALEPGTRRV